MREALPIPPLTSPPGTSASAHKTERTPGPGSSCVALSAKGSWALGVPGSAGSRVWEGAQAPWRSCSLAAGGCLEEAARPGWVRRGGRPSGAPTTRARPSGRRLRSRGLRSGSAGPCLSRSAPRGNYRGAQRCGRAPRGSARWLEAFKLKAALGRGGGRGPPSQGRGRRAQRPHCLRPPRGGTLR